MRMYDVIQKKKAGETLSKDEIHEMIQAYVAEEIPDYQMAAFLMAVYFQGMTAEELTELTMAMAHSGEMVDLSPIPGIKVDKHSTGGVGDKTTLVIAPIVAACGGKVAKMSGRGLGHTGGTVDKLESIPGFQTEMTQEKFFEIVKRTGVSVIGQSGNLVPADKKLYALRDVTATVDSLPLIAASVMSKKIAAGSDKIVLDVTTGSGAFLENMEESLELAKTMVSIGELAERETVALITNMDTPLGIAIGNALEVKEVIEILHGKGPEDLRYVCVQLAANMLYVSGVGEIDTCIRMAEEALDKGTAYDKFREMVEAQGGNVEMLDHPEQLPSAPYQCEVKAEQEGYIVKMNTKQCGIASVVLGAGRETKESTIDMAAGIHIYRKTGDYVKQGETLAVVFAEKEEKLQPACKLLAEAYFYGTEKPAEQPFVYARVTKDGVERYE